MNPPFAGSSPVVRPFSFFEKRKRNKEMRFSLLFITVTKNRIFTIFALASSSLPSAGRTIFKPTRYSFSLDREDGDDFVIGC